MKKTIVIDTSLCEKIEALQYEVESRKDLISYIIANGLVINGDQFEKYQTEYKNYFAEYNKAKQEMIDKYIGDNSIHWNLQFKTKELTIEG